MYPPVVGPIIDIEHDLLGSVHGTVATAEDPVWATFLGPVVVQVPVLRPGHVGIILLDPTEHLLVERLLERLGMRHPVSRVRVLLFEILDDLGILLLPEPRVLIDTDISVGRDLDRSLWRIGWSLGGHGSASCHEKKKCRQQDAGVHG